MIRDWSDALAKPSGGDRSPPSSTRRRGMEEEALDRALKEHGLALEAYREALQADPMLADLERASITQAQAGEAAPDPGPYDEISRESPSGQPGDLRKSRSNPEF
ncbi:MAG: hypothetical protein HUU21_27310 [Polyangiaceae bacterium]|nr:hypothetical protein [Polyangiaceae bacterium]